jgi:ribosomal protein S18 acetylase RimI-like enzyme
MLHVRPANAGDMQTVLGFIDEASRWLPMKNTDQWSRPWPNSEGRDYRIRRGLEARRTWMVEDNGSPIATISCRPDANQELWSTAEQQTPAVYVSRLIVARSHAGTDIGRELLDWAGFWANVQYGAQLIRIDVWTTNGALQNYYEKRGFERVRFADNVEYPSAALLQKVTGDISAADITRLREIPRLLRPAGQQAKLTLTDSLARLRAEQFSGLRPAQATAAFAYLTRPTLFRNRSNRGAGHWHD